MLNEFRAAGTRCLMAEDVVAAGLSSHECIAAIEADGSEVVAGCCPIDRSGGMAVARY